MAKKVIKNNYDDLIDLMSETENDNESSILKPIHIKPKKVRCNLTLNPEILIKVKHIAIEKHTSVSEIVDEYLKSFAQNNS